MLDQIDIYMYCVNCGQLLPDNAKYCINCGLKQIIYDEIIYAPDCDIVRISNKWGLIDKAGNVIFDMEFDSISPTDTIEETVFIVEQCQKIGLISFNTKSFIVPCEYDGIKVSTEDNSGRFWYHLKQNGKWNVVEYPDIEVSPFIFDEIYPSVDIICNEFTIPEYKIQIGDKCGYYRYPDEVLVSCAYDDVSRFQDSDCFKVLADGKWGVRKNDNEIMPIFYDDIICPFSGNSYFLVKNNGKYFFGNLEYGLPYSYDNIFTCYIKTQWEVKVKFHILQQSGKFGICVVNNSRSYIFHGDEFDEIVIDSYYISQENCFNEYCVIRIGNLYGVYDNGLIPCIFDEGPKLVINKTGYNQREVYKYSCYKVKRNGRYGIYDSFGMKLIDCQFDNIESIDIDFSETMFVCTDCNKLGLYDYRGKQLIKVAYDEIKFMYSVEYKDFIYHDIYVVRNNGNYGVYIIQNDNICRFVPCIYDDIRWDTNGSVSVTYRGNHVKYKNYSDFLYQMLTTNDF